MSKKEHRLGVEEVTLVRRRLKVVEPDKTAIALAVGEIDEIFGLDEVSFDHDLHLLYVAYDASRICLDRIEEVLERHKVNIAPGWWNHCKEEYYHFVDQNIKENAGHEPFSCHRVPPHK